MAKLVVKDATFTVDGHDFSAYVSEIKIETIRDEVDVTTMGAANKEIVAGLGDATITAKVVMDYSALDNILYNLSISDTPFNVVVTPDGASIGGSNPEYTMSSLLFNYSPIDVTVGAASATDLVFRNASQAGLTRAAT